VFFLRGTERLRIGLKKLDMRKLAASVFKDTASLDDFEDHQRPDSPCGFIERG
jgi:hypothetical protein